MQVIGPLRPIGGAEAESNFPVRTRGPPWGIGRVAAALRFHAATRTPFSTTFERRDAVAMVVRAGGGMHLSFVVETCGIGQRHRAIQLRNLTPFFGFPIVIANHVNLGLSANL